MLAKYAGGKGACADQILRFRPANFGEFRDPFCGNCPFLWNTDILPLSLPRWVNDLDPCVYNYWMALVHEDDFVDRVQKMIWPIVHSAQRVYFRFLRNVSLIRRAHDPAAWLFVKRMAHRQITHLTRPNIASFSFQELSNGCSSLKTLTRARMTLARDIARGISDRHGNRIDGEALSVTRSDYWQVMTAPPKTDRPVFVLCDIPYRTESHGSAFYGHWFTEEQHSEFFERVLSLDRSIYRVLVTLDWTPKSHEQWRLSRWARPPYLWTFGRYDLPRGMSSNPHRVTKNELIACNYNPMLS